MMCVFAGDWCNPVASWRYYASVSQLGLPGATHLRLPDDQARTYRELAGYLKAESDTFVTVPGLNSLYLWTGKTPPSSFVVSGILRLSETDQADVVLALQRFQRPMLVLNQTTAQRSLSRGPLCDLIQTRGREVQRFGDYTIFQLAETPVAKIQ